MIVPPASIDELLFKERNPLKKDLKEIEISVLINWVRDEMIYVPVDDQQRPFKPNLTQFKEIINDLSDNYHNSTMTLTDIDKQIDFLKYIIKNTKGKKNVNDLILDLKYYSELKKKGYKYIIDDGQHRLNYINKFFMDSSKIYGEEIRELKKFLKIKIPIYFCHSIMRKNIVNLFQSMNSGKMVRTSDKLWGTISDLNEGLKDLSLNKPILRRNLNRQRTEVHRDTYNIWFQITKVCGFYEKLVNKDSISGNGVIDFIGGDLKISDFESIIDIYDDYNRVLNKLENYSNAEFATYNLYFTLHVLKLKGTILSDKDIMEIVYICGSIIEKNKSSNVRYKKIKSIIDERLA